MIRLCLFEDAGVDLLEPLTLTRPAFALRCGASDLRSKQLRYFGATAHGVLVRPQLAGVFRLEDPDSPVNDLDWLRSDATLFVNSRWLPPHNFWKSSTEQHVALIGNEVAYAMVHKGLLTACCPKTINDCLGRWQKSLPHARADGHMIRYPWDLVKQNHEQLIRDFSSLNFERNNDIPNTVAVSGSLDQLAVAADAKIEPFVAINTTAGPVIMDRGAVISSFSRLEGPCYVGPMTQIAGANIRGGTSLGPQCRIGGEVEASVFQGYSNKYHDGFLGHAYAGEWVNLGAGTHNSDLRNDYGEVAVPINQTRVRTGLNKVGCFIGDHTKTGLGTLINTGSNIGAFANLLPAGMLAPKYVPSFTNLWKGKIEELSDLDQSLMTAAKVMQRRGCELTEAHVDLYQHLFEETAFMRKRVIQEKDKRKVSA